MAKKRPAETRIGIDPKSGSENEQRRKDDISKRYRRASRIGKADFEQNWQNHCAQQDHQQAQTDLRSEIPPTKPQKTARRQEDHGVEDVMVAFQFAPLDPVQKRG